MTPVSIQKEKALQGDGQLLSLDHNKVPSGSIFVFTLVVERLTPKTVYFSVPLVALLFGA